MQDDDVEADEGIPRPTCANVSSRNALAHVMQTILSGI